ATEGLCQPRVALPPVGVVLDAPRRGRVVTAERPDRVLADVKFPPVVRHPRPPPSSRPLKPLIRPRPAPPPPAPRRRRPTGTGAGTARRWPARRPPAAPARPAAPTRKRR